MNLRYGLVNIKIVSGLTLVTSTHTLMSNFFPIIINGFSIYFYVTHIVSLELLIDLNNSFKLSWISMPLPLDLPPGFKIHAFLPSFKVYYLLPIMFSSSTQSACNLLRIIKTGWFLYCWDNLLCQPNLVKSIFLFVLMNAYHSSEI